MNRPQTLESWAKSPAQPIDFQLSGKSIRLDESLRHLPNRRLTCLAKWQNKKVVAKFFYDVRFQQYAAKEAEVIKALMDAGISTPALLHMSEQDDNAAIIIEYLENSTSLLAWLEEEPSPAEFESILSKITLLFLACHKAGFEIKDPHLENFLIRGDNVFIIDAGDIIQTNSALSEQRSLENVALLYAQLAVTYDVEAYRVFKGTLEQVDRLELPDEKKWQELLIKKRRWRARKFIDKKVFRECTAYVCEQDWSKFLVAKREFYTADMAQALTNPDALIENGALLKDGNTATVALVEILGKSYVLKRYNIKKPIHSLFRGFKWSRAATSWRNGLLLEMLGIPTAKSYVLIEERWGALRRRSYLLSEYIDAPQAWDVFEEESFSEETRVVWAKKLYDLFLLLKRSQISHGDLKAQNILCTEEGALLIDLDGMSANQNKLDFLRQFKKDIQRFQISWPLKWKENPYFEKYSKVILGE